MPNQSLDQIQLTRLKGIGLSLEKKFALLEIYNVQDLLFHLPHRYEDRTRVTYINEIKLGDQTMLRGEIVSSSIQFSRRRSLNCIMHDGTGFLSLRFFHFSAAQKKTLAIGKLIQCYGEVRRGKSGFEIYHPEYKIVDDFKSIPISESLTPIYPTTDGIQQTRLRSFMQQALEILDHFDEIKDYLPPEIMAKFKLCGLTSALKMLHRPPIDSALSWINDGFNPGHKRLAFEELLAHRLCMRKFRNDSLQKSAPIFKSNNPLINLFLKSLPFTLTKGQKSAYKEISRDLGKTLPMLRLLQGDVGSGKTIVAALASLHAINNNFQVAFMAPTEILAEQHFQNFLQWFSGLDITIGWLRGKSKGMSRDQQLLELASGSCQLIIGTHALFQDDIKYHKLGLIIIDEQHRFGVHQRLTLRNKALNTTVNPHQLVMTATPIPRTLAMSAYADLDSSVINELPSGRIPVNTVIMPSQRRDEVARRIKNACAKGSQAYWVCTLIEESEALESEAAEVTRAYLTAKLPDIKIGLIHGRMNAKEKAEIMTQFRQGLTKVLVATTVIEVGVDVPNASLMIIENPERLGLAQLHQLRGRIGRSNLQSYCILLYQAPLSETSKQRLSVIRDSNDGFYIAEKDLELRGPGQVLGTQQTGLMSFKIADLGRDAGLLEDIKCSSEIILQNHPKLVDPLIRRWLGDRKNYVNV